MRSSSSWPDLPALNQQFFRSVAATKLNNDIKKLVFHGKHYYKKLGGKHLTCTTVGKQIPL